ncbi:hypothetical protein TPHA_0B01000 [Tetrapisispora phaffii CBS 4417]|uniref:EF-hand domain-containing protein n=1 Tax=Tetrapisispora phaffii (strain ATCC 24235 / CBS 4417 / NBRC 1672 / NRRL Y-8282 / UCD 70-5) TaxID=1071381 RepID=G8BQH5_TETPH|nr:hypothetical protein TPHA_0B01000 [Tetrapisispora phaffii CBS 4417]CCE61772.1 hypothetical protein TPHA_0B01000 [Tetrapisispora phaffii CBS 4417]
MCAKKLNYAAGDDLKLYATPEEAMREGKRQLEEEKLRRQRMYEVNNNKVGVDTRIYSAPPSVGIPPGNGRDARNWSHNSYNQSYANRTPPVNNIQSQFQNTPPNNISYKYQHNAVHNSVPVFDRNKAIIQQRPPLINNVPNPSLPQVDQQRHSSLSSLGAVNQTPITNSPSAKEDRDNKIALTLFSNHDSKGRGRLTAEELQNFLQNDDGSYFCISAIDALVNLFGATRFGTINQQEFVALYKKVKNWRVIYVDNDINRSCTLNVNEYHNALQELGYLIPFEVTEKLFEQYAEFINQAVNSKELKFDKFVESLIWLVRLSKLFRKHDVNKEGIASIQYKDFIDMVLYLGRFLPH